MKTLAPMIWFLMLAVGCQSALADGDAANGRKLAEQHCSRCHIVGDFNKYGGIGSTPSFQSLANNFPDYKERFRTFFARNPHPSFVIIEGSVPPELPPNAAPVKLPLQAPADLLAFVEMLKTR